MCVDALWYQRGMGNIRRKLLQMIARPQNLPCGRCNMTSLQVTVGVRWTASRNVRIPSFSLPIRGAHTILK